MNLHRPAYEFTTHFLNGAWDATIKTCRNRWRISISRRAH